MKSKHSAPSAALHGTLVCVPLNLTSLQASCLDEEERGGGGG